MQKRLDFQAFLHCSIIFLTNKVYLHNLTTTIDGLFSKKVLQQTYLLKDFWFYLDSTLCPPNSFRKDATTLPENVSSSNER